MKKILSIGCALLVISACQKQVATKLPIKDVNKSTRHDGVHCIHVNSNSGIAEYIAIEDFSFSNGGTLTINPDHRGQILDASNNPVINITGFAYDRNGGGEMYILHRPSNNVDWEISRLTIYNPMGAAIPFATLNNTAGITELCDLEIMGTDFYALDRSDAVNKNFKIMQASIAGGGTGVTFGPILLGGTIDVQSIYTTGNNVLVLDKQGPGNEFALWRINSSLQTAGSTLFNVSNVPDAAKFSLADYQGKFYLTLDNYIAVDNVISSSMPTTTLTTDIEDLSSK